MGRTMARHGMALVLAVLLTFATGVVAYSRYFGITLNGDVLSLVGVYALSYVAAVGLEWCLRRMSAPA